MNTNSNNTKIINTSNITNNNNDGEWPTKPTKPQRIRQGCAKP